MWYLRHYPVAVRWLHPEWVIFPNLIGKDNGLLVEPRNSHQLCEALDIALARKWDQADICGSVSTLTWDAAASQYYSVLLGACSDV